MGAPCVPAVDAGAVWGCACALWPLGIGACHPPGRVGARQGGRLLAHLPVTTLLSAWQPPKLVLGQFANLGLQPGSTYTLWAVNNGMQYPVRATQASNIAA